MDELKIQLEKVLEMQNSVTEMLEFLAAAKERLTWRPIESAPKDGRKILMYAKGDTTMDGIVYNVSTALWSDIQDEWMLLEIDRDGHAGVAPIEALCWMPLPEPPERS